MFDMHTGEVDLPTADVWDLPVISFAESIINGLGVEAGHILNSHGFCIIFYEPESEYRWSSMAVAFAELGSAKVDAEVRCFRGRPDNTAENIGSEIFMRATGAVADFRYAEHLGEDAYWTSELTITSRDVRFGDLFSAFDAVGRLADLKDPARAVDLSSALRMLSGNVPELLIGLLENDWLEGKSRAYDLGNHAENIELAKDVAQFANSPSGGLLVVGVRTKNGGRGDEIVKLAPLALPGNTEERYRRVIDRRVYPPISGLVISRSSVGPQGEILYVHVPPQAENSRPFIVEGGVLSGDAYENFFMIPQRRGTDVHPISGRAIQALLAGRLFRDPGGT